jgi:hypothetical protein
MWATPWHRGNRSRIRVPPEFASARLPQQWAQTALLRRAHVRPTLQQKECAAAQRVAPRRARRPHVSDLCLARPLSLRQVRQTPQH